MIKDRIVGRTNAGEMHMIRTITTMAATVKV